MKKLRVLTPIILAIIALLGWSMPVMAATTATVTVTQAVSYIAITIAPTTYTLNSDNGASGKVSPNTTYYSNPLGSTTSPSATVDVGECDFTITNTSTIVTDLTGNMSDFSGGSDNSTNSNLGTNDTTKYGAYAYYSGETYSSKVILKASGSDTGNFKASLAATTNIKVGFELKTQSNAWTGANSATSTLTITSTVH